MAIIRVDSFSQRRLAQTKQTLAYLKKKKALSWHNRLLNFEIEEQNIP